MQSWAVTLGGTKQTCSEGIGNKTEDKTKAATPPTNDFHANIGVIYIDIIVSLDLSLKFLFITPSILLAPALFLLPDYIVYPTSK